MAVEMLVEETNNKVPHAYYHDLESVFYALCWVCTSQEGPNSTPRDSTKFKFDDSEVSKWNGVGLDNPTLDEIRRYKAATVYSDTEFTERVLDQFAPYFEPLKPCIAALRQVMINKDSNGGKMAPLYRMQLSMRKEALARARQNGDPIDALTLSLIPNSERDHRDVFQSLYLIIDTYLADLVEPEFPKPCDEPPENAAKGKKPTREEIDNKNPRSVRELVDKNADDMAFRVKAVVEQKNRERNANVGIDSATIPHSGLISFHQYPGPDESQLDESDVPSPRIGRRIADEAVMTSSHPDMMSFRSAQQTKSLDSGSSTLLPSPLIRRRSDRIRKSTGGGNMPPPSTPGRAKHRSSTEYITTPASLIGRHSPPSSVWSSSSKRSASEFEDNESGQKTPTQMSSPKKQRRR